MFLLFSFISTLKNMTLTSFLAPDNYELVNMYQVKILKFVSHYVDLPLIV